MVRMKTLIVGCGRIGARLAQALDREGHEVTIIDRDPGAFDRFASRGVFDRDFRGNFVVGDGTEAEVLRRAGIEDADCFVAVTQGDNRNIMAAQIAQHIFKVPKVVCRIYDPIRDEAYRKLGLRVFCPTTEGAARVRSMILDEDR
ncbi:MAG TPA: TrkA family potassium uptake protein [Candidatus Dormibacteraeota bacterium]|nr:TrkA family potassium uptake protein [Candidatus Dormibacteraeota bacterium]